MGGKSDTEIRNEVAQELSIEINNVTKNISKNIIKTVTDVTNSIVQKNLAISEQTIGNNNIITAESIKIGKGSEFSINQKIKSEAMMTAVTSIINDASSMQELINQVMTKLDNKIKNENEIAAEMQQAARLTKLEKDAGGPEAMIEDVTKMVKDVIASISGGSSNSSNVNLIKTTVRQRLLNETINDSTFETDLKNAITNTMEQNSTGLCKQIVINNNRIDLGKIEISDGLKVPLNQEINEKSLINCLFDSKSGTKAVQTAGLDSKAYFSSDTDNKSKSESKTSQETTMKIEQEKTSSIMSALEKIASGFFNLLSGPYMIIAAVIGLVIIIAAVMLFSGKIKLPKKMGKMGKVNGVELPELTDEQDGGFLKLFLNNNQHNSFNYGESTLGMRDF